MDNKLETELAVYMQACNNVLSLHEKAVTDHVTTDLACRILEGHPIKLVIYEDNLDNPCCQTDIMYEKGRFMKTGPSSDKPDIVWTIDRRHIDEIAADPQAVLEHPEKLNWGCLASRVGVKIEKTEPRS